MSSHTDERTVHYLWKATTRGASGNAPVTHDSRVGAAWTIVIALVFFWLSNPLVLWVFSSSVRNAAAVTLGAVLLTARSTPPQPPLSVLVVLGFGSLSALWSTFSRLTVDFTLLYVVIALIALAVATTADARTIAQGMLLGGVLIVTASFYTFKAGYVDAAVIPGTEGYMAGVGGNRNILAYTLAVALAFGVGFLPRRWWARCCWAAGIGSLLVGIYLAESGTGYLVATVVLVIAAVAAATDRWHPPSPVRSRRRRWLVRGGIGLLIGVALVGLEVVSRILDRDLASLSGRVPLWEAIWDETVGLERWFGAGWGVVWPHPWYQAAPNAAYDEIVARYGDFLTHGHNSFFDLIPEIGALGAALFALVYVQASTRVLALRDGADHTVRRSRLEASRITLLGIVALLVFGLSEPMSTIPLGWFALVLLATGLRPGVDRRDASALGASCPPPAD